MKSEEMFSKLFQVSPMALTLTSAEDNRYIEVNSIFERLTGWTRNEVIGRTPADIGLWVDPSQRTDLVRRLRSGDTVRNLDFTVRTKDGEIRRGLGSAELIEIDGELCVLSIATDVTERAQADAALRERERHFRVIANTAPVVIWLTDVERRCTYVNGPWLEFTGRSLEAELGYGWTESLHPDDVEPCLGAYMRAFDRRDSVHVEYRLRRRDGEYRWFLATGVPRYDGDRHFLGYIGSAIDISERKRLEEALSTTSQRLIDAHEEERRRVARQLHDNINQRLAVLTVSLDSLQRGLPDSAAELRQLTAGALESMSDIVKDLQAISFDLHSPTLDLLGLGAAAKSLCEEFSVRHRMAISCRAETVPTDLPPEIARCLFRVLQEALKNAIQHSGAPHVHVVFEYDAHRIELIVRDLGRGFDAYDAVKGRGVGLTSMRERMKLVGGQLSIDARPQSGTTIRARVPIPA